MISLLEAESEATAAYSAIVLAQLARFSAEKDSQHYEIDKINKQMKKIIANRVGAQDYSNYTDDQLLNFNYEGTIRRTPAPNDTLRSHSRASLSSRASDLSYQQGYTSRRKPSTGRLHLVGYNLN